GCVVSRFCHETTRLRDCETTLSPGDAAAIPDRIEDFYRPVAAGVAPDVGHERAGVTAEEHDFVASWIVSHASVLARGRNGGRMELRPDAAIPIPHVCDVRLHFGGCCRRRYGGNGIIPKPAEKQQMIR